MEFKNEPFVYFVAPNGQAMWRHQPSHTNTLAGNHWATSSAPLCDVIPPYWYSFLQGLILFGLIVMVTWSGFLTIFPYWRKRSLVKAEARRKRAALMRAPECMRPNSLLGTRNPMNCQLAFYSFDSRSKYYDGSGLRIDDHFVFPMHVLTKNTEVFYHTGERDWKKIQLPEDWQKAVVEVFPDVGAYPVPKNMLGLIKKAKVGPILGNPFVSCVSARASQNASYGSLALNPDHGFGMLDYSGSTIKGFSGGVYSSVDVVLGMHLGGGAVNYGVSLEMVRLRLARMARKTQESSELAAVSRALAYARKSDFDVHAAGDPDYVELQVGGKFFLLDVDDYQQLQQEDRYAHFFYQDGEVPKGKKVKFVREEFENAHESVLGDDDFLDEPLETPEEQPDIGCLQCKEPQMQNLEPLEKKLKECLLGLHKMQEQLETLSKRTADCENSLGKLSQESTRESLISLLDEFEVPTNQMYQGLRSQVKENMTGISNLSSELSILRAQQGSERSQDMQRSEMPSDGMERAFAKLKEWRSSKNPLDKDYVALRKAFLDENGWTPQEQTYLINRLRNFYQRRKQKAIRASLKAAVEPKM